VSDEQTFEQAQRELDEIVGRLERGDVPIDDAIALWHRGEDLASHPPGRETVMAPLGRLGHSERQGAELVVGHPGTSFSRRGNAARTRC